MASKVREAGTLRRSRFGCRNCKLRKLKCDERKPQCTRCTSFGVLCPFMSGVPDLQPVAGDAAGRALAVVRGTSSPRPPPTSAVWTADAASCYQLNARCQDFITRYLGRSLITLITPDDPAMAQVNRQLLDLAFAYPFLMHASLAVALTYDRHLHPPTPRRTLEECHHWSRATVLFAARLRSPISAAAKDAIWATAAALAILAVASPDPHPAWPLTSAPATDLAWLRQSDAKMALWPAVDPLRADSIFRVMAPTYARMHAPSPEGGVAGIPPTIAATCSLSDSSTAESNPYFLPAHALAQVLALPDSAVTTGHTQRFAGCMRGRFEGLLRERDPTALLLLYLWYRKAGRCVWWIGLRAGVECPSICLYLQLYHKDNGAVLAFLPGGALADRWA